MFTQSLGTLRARLLFSILYPAMFVFGAAASVEEAALQLFGRRAAHCTALQLLITCQNNSVKSQEVHNVT